MAETLRCPVCSSTDAECRDGRHVCNACGFDGQAKGETRVHLLELWQALGGDVGSYDRWMADQRRTVADGWAQLLAAVAGNVASLFADTNPPAGDELLALLKTPEPIPEGCVRVTCEDGDGPAETAIVGPHDYILIPVGECRLDHVQKHGNGTHVLTVKGRR